MRKHRTVRGQTTLTSARNRAANARSVRDRTLCCHPALLSTAGGRGRGRRRGGTRRAAGCTVAHLTVHDLDGVVKTPVAPRRLGAIADGPRRLVEDHPTRHVAVAVAALRALALPRRPKPAADGVASMHEPGVTQRTRKRAVQPAISALWRSQGGEWRARRRGMGGSGAAHHRLSGSRMKVDLIQSVLPHIISRSDWRLNGVPDVALSSGYAPLKRSSENAPPTHR